MASTPCCPTDIKPAINNYKGTGRRVTFKHNDETLELYLTGNTNNNTDTDSVTAAIVVVTDVFGVTPHAEQFADALGSALATNYLVCMPSFIQDPWDPLNIPPSKSGKFPAGVTPADGTDVLIDWIMNHRDMRIDRADPFRAVQSYLKKHDEFKNIAKFGAVGMCWGAKVCFDAAGKGLVDAVAACHGSLLTKEDAEQCHVPMCLLNSKDEPESYAKEIKPVMESKSFSDQNVFREFPKMHHGWMGTRGIGADTDFTHQEQVEGFAQGISELANFFAKVLA